LIDLNVFANYFEGIRVLSLRRSAKKHVFGSPLAANGMVFASPGRRQELSYHAKVVLVAKSRLTGRSFRVMINLYRRQSPGKRTGVLVS